MKEMTEAMVRAMELAKRNGGWVAAGANVVGGCVYHVNARTLDGLISRGLARHRYDSEGGYAAQLVDEVEA